MPKKERMPSEPWSLVRTISIAPGSNEWEMLYVHVLWGGSEDRCIHFFVLQQPEQEQPEAFFSTYAIVKNAIN